MATSRDVHVEHPPLWSPCGDASRPCISATATASAEVAALVEHNSRNTTTVIENEPTILVHINVGKEALQLSQCHRAASLLHACLQFLDCNGATVICVYALQRQAGLLPDTLEMHVLQRGILCTAANLSYA